MRRKRMLLWVGLAVAAGMAASCHDDDVRAYLGENGEMYKWEVRISKAICNLETSTGTTSGDVYCTGGHPPSDTPPPKFPPR